MRCPRCRDLKFADIGKEIYVIEVPVKFAKSVPKDWSQMSATQVELTVSLALYDCSLSPRKSNASIHLKSSCWFESFRKRRRPITRLLKRSLVAFISGSMRIIPHGSPPFRLWLTWIAWSG